VFMSHYVFLHSVWKKEQEHKRERERTVPSTEYLDRKLVEFVHTFYFIFCLL